MSTDYQRLSLLERIWDKGLVGRVFIGVLGGIVILGWMASVALAWELHPLFSIAWAVVSFCAFLAVTHDG